jgi:hypothetical protein
MNRQSPAISLTEAAENALIGHLRRGALGWDEVTIYEHGIMLRPHYGTYSQSFLDEIRDMLSDTGAKLTVVRESDIVHSLRIRFGDNAKPIDADKFQIALEDNRMLLAEVFDRFAWEFADVDWTVFWETDEEMYERRK